MMIGKKKCIDVQFYSEAGTSIEEVHDKKYFNR